MRNTGRSTTVARCVAVALLLIVAACGSDVLSPNFQPEIVNDVDAFSFQVTGLENASSTVTYAWQNTGTTATVNQSASIAAGAVSLVILDANGTQVYSRSLTENGTFVSSAGTSGTWTIRVIFNGAAGTVNFRADRTT